MITNVACYGDSITQGAGGTNTVEGAPGNWIEQWRNRLADLAHPPIIGAGLRCLFNGSSFTLGIPDANGEWNGVGTWTAVSQSAAWNKSPHGQAWGGANGSGSVATWLTKLGLMPVVGFAVYYIDDSTSGNWQYRIDGGTWTNMGETLLHDNNLHKFYVNAAVTTSVDFRQYDGSAAAGCILVGIEPYFVDPRTNPNGMIFHNLGRFGYWLGVTAGILNNGSGADPLAWYDSCVLGTGAVSHTPVLSTLEFANDMAVGAQSPSAWLTNLGIFWTRASPMGIPFVLFGLYELSNLDATNQANFRNNSITFASTHAPLTIFNVFDEWQNLGLGGIGTQAALINGLFLADGTHPNQAGTYDIAQRLLNRKSMIPPLGPSWDTTDGFQAGADLLADTAILAGDTSGVVTDNDNGTSSEAESVTVPGTPADADTGSSAEAGEALVLTDAETGTSLEDGQLVEFANAETSSTTEVEAIAVFPFDTDPYAATDDGIVAAAVPDTDTGAGVDASEALTVDIADNDVWVGNDAGENVTSPGIAADAELVSAADAGELATVFIVDADSAVGTEAAQVVLADTDTGSGADAEQLTVSDNEALTSAEVESVGVLDNEFVSSNEAGEALAVTITDTGTLADGNELVDAGGVFITDAEIHAFLDGQSLLAAANSSDTGVLGDVGQVFRGTDDEGWVPGPPRF